MNEAGPATPAEILYVQYHSSKETTYLNAIRQLISGDLSEPYSVYVYKYFLYQWGDLCFMVTEQPYKVSSAHITLTKTI